MRNAWKYRVEIQSIYLDLRFHDLVKKNLFLIYLKKDMAVYIAKNVCFDSTKGNKINRFGYEYLQL